MMKRHKLSTLLAVNLCLGLLMVSAAPHAQSSVNRHFEFEIVEWEDALIRLDNFFVELGSNPNSNWRIIVYGGQNRRRGEAEAWLACVEDHIFNRRSFAFSRYGLSREQVSLVHGGYRKNVTVEFWLVPPGEGTPSVKPTIESQDVKFRGASKSGAACVKLDAGCALRRQAPSNNGMHPTANSVAFMRETCFNSAVRRGG